MKYLLTLLTLVSFVVSCTQPEETEEASTSTYGSAEGDWTLDSVSCDGTNASLGLSTMSISLDSTSISTTTFTEIEDLSTMCGYVKLLSSVSVDDSSISFTVNDPASACVDATGTVDACSTTNVSCDTSATAGTEEHTYSFEATDSSLVLTTSSGSICSSGQEQVMTFSVSE